MGLTRAYLDSNTVIDLVEGVEERGERVRSRVTNSPGREFVISPLVRLECLVRPLRRGDTDEVARIERIIAGFKNVPIEDSAYSLATHMRARHGLGTPDALHLATARVQHCDELWTSDRAMLSAAPQFAIDVTADR